MPSVQGSGWLAEQLDFGLGGSAVWCSDHLQGWFGEKLKHFTAQASQSCAALWGKLYENIYSFGS